MTSMAKIVPRLAPSADIPNWIAIIRTIQPISASHSRCHSSQITLADVQCTHDALLVARETTLAALLNTCPLSEAELVLARMSEADRQELKHRLLRPKLEKKEDKSGDKTADDLDYVPMPASVKTQIAKAWGDIRDASGKPVSAATPTAPSIPSQARVSHDRLLARRARRSHD